MGDVEVDELGVVVVACLEGDREADLPNWNCGAIGDSGERLGWLKLIVRHLEIVECLYGQDVEPCPAVDEGPVDGHLVDGGGAQHWERTRAGRVGGVIIRAEGQIGFRRRPTRRSPMLRGCGADLTDEWLDVAA